MKDIIINKLKSTINILEHLVYVCPAATELLEEQIAALEHTINFIETWRKEKK